MADLSSFLLKLCHLVLLVRGEDTSKDVLDPDLVSNGLCCSAVVSSEEHHFQPHVSQGLHGNGSLRLDGVSNGQGTNQYAWRGRSHGGTGLQGYR